MMIRMISLVFLAWLTLPPMGLVSYQRISGERPIYRRDAGNEEVSQSFFSAQSLCALRLGGDRAFHHQSLEAALLQSNVTGCDRLAAHPSDPDKVSEGVASQDVKLDQAIAACRQAVAADPENARLNYQLGRVLFYKGDYADGLKHVENAAAGRYRQAQFVAGLVYTDGQKDFLKPEPCRAISLWQDAADRGHYAAEVSLSRNYLRGIYGKCGAKLDHARVVGYLKSASKKTKSYYEKLLVEYLMEEALRGKSK